MIGNECQCGRICLVDNHGKNKEDLTDAVFICPGCGLNRHGCTCKGGPAEHDETYKSTVESVAQDQPQPHGTGKPVGERLIELIRERTKLGIKKYGEPLTTHNGRDALLDALQESIDLNQYLMQALMESKDEVRRLSEEQIRPLADFLMQQSDAIGHPGDEGACAMAIRVIGELIDGD